MTEIIPVSQETHIQIYRPWTSPRGFSIETIIAGWLNEAKRPRTKKAYEEHITFFRSFLLEHLHRDLLGGGEDWAAEIADAAQVWLKLRSPHSHHTGEVAASTQQTRHATLASFYEYSIRRRHSKENPLAMVDTVSVDKYANAQSLNPEEVVARLADLQAEIAASTTDQQRLLLRRNLALITLLLSTGRRANEVVQLRRKHLKMLRNKCIQLTFENAKGGKAFHDTLEPEVSFLLAQWLGDQYQGRFFQCPDETPIWVDVVHAGGKALKYDGVRNAVQAVLGTSKVHMTRHTFADFLKKIGADVHLIAGLLGHESIATTQIYLSKLDEQYNPYAGDMMEALGLRKKPRK